VPVKFADCVELIRDKIIIYLMIAIIDYGMGNLRSVEKGFLKVGVDVKVTNRAEDVIKADGVVLPGVGAFKDCMRELTNLELVGAVVETVKQGKPYLGICLGLQVLFSESQEFGRCGGLDILRGKVVKFESGVRSQESGVTAKAKNSELLTLNSELLPLKVPHMGWNALNIKKDDNPLFAGIPDKSYFYFVHSYYVAPEDASIISTTTDYGIKFTSSVRKGNIFAVQFHPEKSQALGLRILKNFGGIVAGE
jgi:glutamine amidotransferase